MFWVYVAILGPIFHAAANILDDILARRNITNIWTLVFYASLCNLVFLPVLFLMSPLTIGSAKEVLILVMLGLANIVYLFPYYKSLQHIEVSVVSALFSLSRVFIPLGAYIFAGEVLSQGQYIGFFLIILASGLLTLDVKRVRLNVAFFLMALSSLALVGEGVIMKVAFEGGMNWGTVIGGQYLAAFLGVTPMVLVKNLRRDIKNEWKTFTASVHLFASEEALTFLGSAVSVYAISRIPLTLEKAVESFQPFFVLAFMYIFAKFLPKRAPQQKISAGKQNILFFCMLVGAVIMAMY